MHHDHDHHVDDDGGDYEYDEYDDGDMMWAETMMMKRIMICDESIGGKMMHKVTHKYRRVCITH